LKFAPVCGPALGKLQILKQTRLIHLLVQLMIPKMRPTEPQTRADFGIAALVLDQA
jgi:hypothetical protein